MTDNRSLKHRAANRALTTLERVGIHALPTHFYSPIANRRDLRAREPAWRRPLATMPFSWDLEAQSRWLFDAVADYPKEMPLREVFAQSQVAGAFRYGPIEAQFLYSWVRAYQPRRIVEIGSGSSTVMMSLASRRNVADGGTETNIIAIDPYQAGNVASLPHVDARSVGGGEVTAESLALTSGDLLFIDSTHAVRTGSELAPMYLELLPQLEPGVVIHIHDIYLPYLFGPDLYESVFDWQETTLVAALLAGNAKFEILASMSGLFHGRPDALQAAFPEFRPCTMQDGLYEGDDNGHFPSSLWLRTRSE